MGVGASNDSVRHKHSVALLIIDMMNTLDFPEGGELLKHAIPAARSILRLKTRLQTQGIPVIYVNDNFGQWRSSWQDVFKICSGDGCLGRDLAILLKPGPEDYFVLKPKHSGFYSTTLEVLLEALEVRTLILSGIAGNICVLFTANDAHMREYNVVVPRDCVASNTVEDNDYALQQLHHVFGISTRSSTELEFECLI